MLSSKRYPNLDYSCNLNLSKVSDNVTANTNKDSALQRASNLSSYGISSVLELCCGPSLKTLELAYRHFNIECTGNDIDPRWEKFYPDGKWLLGNCLNLNVDSFDCVVFAPPLSKGCTGKREDSLQVDNIKPRYLDFIKMYSDFKGLKVLVLPARSLATKNDVSQLYKLLSNIPPSYEIKILTNGRRQIRKYVDIYYI